LQLAQAENLNQIEPDFAFYSASYEDWDREAREEHIDEDVEGCGTDGMSNSYPLVVASQTARQEALK
jgi:hypothetical protein